MDLGTARVSAILEIFGNPQKSLNVIHVAGTNGKGSICSFLESILVESCGVCTKTNGFERDEEASKLKVGKFTSPHLLSVEDSLRINKVPISDKVLKGIRENVNSVAAGNGIVLTNFETLTITMFLWFKECGVDVAVVEVGLGGALDATNVMEKPLVCVFAPIGFDHEAILGTTIPEIAAHKAGILKKYGKAVIAQQTEISALESLVQTCEKEEVDYVLSGVARIKERTDFSNGSTLVVYTTKTLKVTYEIRHHLQGDFQHTNLACALDVIDVLNAKHSDLFNVTPNQVCSGVSNTAWPGRLQWVDAPGLGQILVDGAHNPSAAQALGNYLAPLIESKLLGCQEPFHIRWVFGATEGKRFDKIISILLNSVKCNHIKQIKVKNYICLVGFSQPAEMPWIHSYPTETLYRQLLELPDAKFESVQQFQTISGALNSLNEVVFDPTHLVVVTGSLYLVADLFRLLNLPC